MNNEIMENLENQLPSEEMKKIKDKRVHLGVFSKSSTSLSQWY